MQLPVVITRADRVGPCFICTASSKLTGRFDFVHVNVLLRIGDGDTGFIEADLDRLEQITTHRPVIGAVHPGTHVDVHAAVPRLSDYDDSLGIFQNTLIGIDYRLDDVTA